jgi:hypothetical protein
VSSQLGRSAQRHPSKRLNGADRTEDLFRRSNEGIDGQVTMEKDSKRKWFCKVGSECEKGSTVMVMRSKAEGSWDLGGGKREVREESE